MIEIAVVVLYVADKILEHFIQEEIWVKRFWHNLFPPKTFKTELVKVIHETIEKYEEAYSFDYSGGKFPFYKSQILFEHLSMYILFDKSSLNNIQGDFRKFPKIIPPTGNDLNIFYDLFIAKTRSNPQLKQLYFEENYKSKIFEIEGVVKQIGETIKSIKTDTESIKKSVDALFIESESKKLNPQHVIEALNSQVNRQLRKQINSGKYLPTTFIEKGEEKDNLRYVCDSVFYSEKCFEECDILDFRHFNNFLAKKHHYFFDFDFRQLKPTNEEMTISNCNEIVSKWSDYLLRKKLEIADMQIDSNEKFAAEYKFRDRVDDLEFLQARVALITEAAGQGKTNFLCDFTENFLLNRKIPTVFLTGAEIKASDLRQSIIQRIFPDSPIYSFQELLNALKTISYNERKFFVLIIDGINENYDSRSFSENLETFLSEVLEHDFVKVVISCRTEYYQQNFQNLEKSSFATTIKKISSFHSLYPEDELHEKLLHIYFEYFNIEHNGISRKAHEQLVDNFLLLRIFCDTYQNHKIESIQNIYKVELFEKYYHVKSEEINKRLKNNDEFRVSGNFDIKNFIQAVVKFMIQEKTYVNVPLDKIITDPKDREIYIRFLDENILVKRDLQSNEKGFFTDIEVVNFTFDEFRDFLISRYLVEVLYEESIEEFSQFLESQITEKSPLLEGCSTFLFFISRRNSDNSLNKVLKKQPWFESVYSSCIFSLEDAQITDDDKKTLKNNILANVKFSDSIILNLILRYDTDYYKNLNIDFLFELLRGLDDKHYIDCFANKFTDNRWIDSKISQEDLISQIDDVLEKREAKEIVYRHKLFELLIYMFINKEIREIQTTYEKYYFRYPEQSKMQLKKAFMSKSKLLIKELQNFMNDYEIGL